ncbi:MAG: hypothetical protein DI564_13695 [Rhodanobacter denitrificans]|uniref:DNA-binding protein n=1 Tax=Rhodanobacter denitrificans TaxID=666685 RepID=A0A2W5LXE9_9GAMM|nr:MAG: hypothetical protein DI564_13695 [Rhodanobacter denitrificans]
MPEKKTTARAKRAKREGKSPSTQAGAYVHEEIEHIREGKHGAKSTKQAIAIGLSKARRAGVKVGTPKKASASTRRKARQDSAQGEQGTAAGKKTSATRSRATKRALKKAPTRAASSTALSRHAKSAAKKRTASSRSAAAKKAARTKGAAGRSAAAKKAARTRKRAA